jgi:hypothetical protein
VKSVSEEKKKRRGPGIKVGEPKDISGQVSTGWDKIKRTGTEPIPSGSRIPPEAKKKAGK